VCLVVIKEEPVDHEFIEFQEPSRKNSVTENTAQLDTDSSTAEKSNIISLYLQIRFFRCI
jgi:hypothetical protein